MGEPVEALSALCNGQIRPINTMPSRLTGFVCPPVSMVTTGHATGVEKTLFTKTNLYEGFLNYSINSSSSSSTFIDSKESYKQISCVEHFHMRSNICRSRTQDKGGIGRVFLLGSVM